MNLRKLIVVPFLVLPMLVLAGCATTGVTPPDRPRLDPPSAQSMQSCKLPADLPPGEMTQRDIERYWGADRKHLVECLTKHGILRDYIVDRDGGLTKKATKKAGK